MDLGCVSRSHSVQLPTKSMDSNMNQMSSQQIPYVIYRNSKYSGFLRRLNQYFIIYSRFYVLQPILIRLSQLDIYLIELLGFFILLCTIPFLIFSACVLFLIRRVRITLVKKFHPNAIICEDLSPRCILTGKSHGIVTAVVWTHGKITLQSLRSELIPFKTSILQKKLTDRFGIRVLVETLKGSEYDISDHIVEAPSKFYQVNLTDEDSSQGQKSSLQKFVTSCASKRLNPDKPPWEITLIPQPSYNKERTCCVLRFHYLLLRDKKVQRFLGDIFTRKLESILLDGSENEAENIIRSCSEEPVKIILLFTALHWRKLKNWIQNNFILTNEDLKTWANLRKKQWEFHSKSTLLKAKLFEIVFKISQILPMLKSIAWVEFWDHVKHVISAIFLILRALSYIPIELIGCFWGVSPEKNGIRRAGKSDTRQVAWSAPISKDLLDAIQEKTDATLESVILTACSMALRDYYDETGLRNPKHLRISVPETSEDLLAPSGFKGLRLSTKEIPFSQQLNKINGDLHGYPAWKILGSYYTLTNISYALPRPLAFLVLKRLFRRYPITFNCVDLEPPHPVVLSTMSLWGQPVDEFIFWRSPQTDFCVSIMLVKYLETRRVAVISPMKVMDRALTKYFGQYLNRIAESLGVCKSRIPYSRRSSPGSSQCSSPSISLYESSLRSQTTRTIR